MNKIICFFALVILMTTQSFASNPITEEKQAMNVVAGSGLKMRTAPNLSAQTLKVIPYGERVYVIADSMMVEDRIEWMDGNWIKIEHMGDQGYVFDGFLTSLPIPQFDFELTIEDLGLMSSLESWMEYRFDQDGEPLIYEEEKEIKMITSFVDGHKKIEHDTEFMYSMAIQIKDIQLSEAYNILKGMCLTGYEKASYVNNSIFVEDKYGDINKIKINIETPIEIKEIGNSIVQIRIKSFHGECKL